VRVKGVLSAGRSIEGCQLNRDVEVCSIVATVTIPVVDIKPAERHIAQARVGCVDCRILPVRPTAGVFDVFETTHVESADDFAVCACNDLRNAHYFKAVLRGV
jgi:hypothetical protein